MDEVARQDFLEEHQYAQPAELPKVPPHLRPLEEKRAAIAEFHRTFPFDKIVPGSLTSLLEEEREALRHIYPNSLVDLGREGIIKVRVFREDGSSYFLPEDEEADS